MLRIDLVRRIILADLTFASDGKKFANTCHVIPRAASLSERAET